MSSPTFNPASPPDTSNPSANSWPTFYSNVAASHHGQQDSAVNFKKVLPTIATTEELRNDMCYCPNTVMLVVAAPFFKIRYLHQFHWDRSHPTLPGATNEFWALMGIDDNPQQYLYHGMKLPKTRRLMYYARISLVSLHVWMLRELRPRLPHRQHPIRQLPPHTMENLA